MTALLLRWRNRPLVTLLIPVLIALMLLAVFASYWSAFVQYCIAFQISMHRYLVMYMLQEQSGRGMGGVMLVGCGFLYGFLHAVGPGHGKFVITTWLATSREHARASRLITLAGSLMQGVVAIAFVWVLAVGLNLSMGELSVSRFYVEKASALFIGLFGLMMLARAAGVTLRLPSLRRTAAQPAAMRNFTPLGAHQHGADCGCGHQPLASVQALNGDWKTRLWVIISIGIRPCSGALLILIFANAIGFFSWGIAAAMSMALGTALSIMLVATLVTRVRERMLTMNQSLLAPLAQRAFRLAALIAGLLLLMFAAVLFFSVIPISANGDFIAAGC